MSRNETALPLNDPSFDGARSIVPSVFVRRCRVCGAEIKTEWGPETFEQAERDLRTHLDHHSFSDFYAWAFREHSVSGGSQ